MSDEPNYLKIEIPEEEETPFVPEQPQPTAVDAVKTQTVGAAKQVWDSELRKKATQGMKRGATAVAAIMAPVAHKRSFVA